MAEAPGAMLRMTFDATSTSSRLNVARSNAPAIRSSFASTPRWYRAYRLPMHVVAVGDVMLDVAARARAGPNERVHGPIITRAGGSAVGVALAAAAAGAEAAVIGRVGDDMFGKAIRSELTCAGVAPLLAVDPQLPTGTVIALGESELSVVADRGANAGFVPADLPSPLQAETILVSGYVLFHADTHAAGRAALASAQARWLAVDIASPALIKTVGAEEVLRRCARANGLILNADQAYELTGVGAAQAAESLAARFELVVITLGSEGAFAFDSGRIVRAKPPEPVHMHAFGAGDAFAGTLLAKLAQGEAIEEALSAACRAGADAAAR